LIWNPSGDEIRVVSLDGKALTVALDKDALDIMEDRSALIAAEVLSSSTIPAEPGNEDAGDDEKDEDDDGSQQTGRHFLRFYGADRSCNDLFDAVICIIETTDLAYRTPAQDVSYVVIMKNYEDGDEAVKEELLRQLTRFFAGGSP
ncbi:hypothetical protein HK405_009191, partial [Cladochytrium tenue]